MSVVFFFAACLKLPPFLCICHLFPFLVLLHRPLSTVSSKTNERRLLVLFPVLEGIHFILSTQYDISCRLFIDAFYQIEEVSLYFILSILSWMGIKFCQMLGFFLHLLIWSCDLASWILNINQPCIPIRNITWFWCIILFDVAGLYLLIFF